MTTDFSKSKHTSFRYFQKYREGLMGIGRLMGLCHEEEARIRRKQARRSSPEPYGGENYVYEEEEQEETIW